MFTRTPLKDSDRSSGKDLRDIVETLESDSENLQEIMEQIAIEDQKKIEQKGLYADKIFTFLISTYNRPNWNEEDAKRFKFSTANAMRHFLRKHSGLYKDYRQSMANRLDESIQTQFEPPRINIKKQYSSFGDSSKLSNQKSKKVINPLQELAEIKADQDLRAFLKHNEEDDILAEYRQTYTYRGQPEDVGLPVFNGELHLQGDMLLVGDIHVPSTNWEFMEKITQVAKRQLTRPRKIVIVGDILNGDKDSRYEHIIAPISRHKEFKITDALLQTWSRFFDEIYITPGNHLHRLIRRLEGDIGMNEIARLLTSAHEKIVMSHYDEVHVTSGDERWVATHQANYAKSKLKIGNLLAQKFQANIVTFHQHHSAIGRDDFNRYTIIDCGGMHQQSMMSYVKLVPNVMPNMNNGFVLLRDGTGHLLTPYPSITDWSMWGG